MAYAMTKRGSLDNCVTYEFICDTVADMNAIEDRYRTIGSTAVVLQGDAGLEVYISGSDKIWTSLSVINSGSVPSGGGLSFHICGQDELDANGLPDVSEPDEVTFYLVPAADETTGNIYDEYIYVDDGWEKFGSGKANGIDLSNYATLSDISGFYTKPNGGIPAADLANNISLSDFTNDVIFASEPVSVTPVVTNLYSDRADWVATIKDKTTKNIQRTATLNVDSEEEQSGDITVTYTLTGLNLSAGETVNYQWSYSLDGGTTWTLLDETTNHFSYIWSHEMWKRSWKTEVTIDIQKIILPDTSLFAPKANPEFTGSISLDRYTGSTVGELSVSLGRQTKATGNYSFAEGNYTTASGSGSHAEGQSTVASAYNAHAEGLQTKARGDYSHAEGKWDTSNQTTTYGNTTYYYGASGVASHSEGANTIAHGDASHAEGQNTKALSVTAHSEGYSTIASGADAHAEGSNTTASGFASHAEGSSTTASTDSAHAEGYSTTASGAYAHAEGGSTTASARESHAEGYNTQATNDYAHAEGYHTVASGSQAHAEGADTIASGNGSHAEGASTTASGNLSHAEGAGTRATGVYSHAEGANTIASGTQSHAEGAGAQASGAQSHAEGMGTTASGNFSHAEGASTFTSGAVSHAEGAGTTAINMYSHSEGNYTIASGLASHSEGEKTGAIGAHEHVSGRYNVLDSAPAWVASTSYNVGDLVSKDVTYTNQSNQQAIYTCIYKCKTANSDTTFTSSKWEESGVYAEIIGNGTATNARSNARTLDWNGNERLMGDLYVGCNADSTGGTKLARIPDAPSTDGTYTLQCVVTNGEPTYTWISTGA